MALEWMVRCAPTCRPRESVQDMTRRAIEHTHYQPHRRYDKTYTLISFELDAQPYDHSR